MMKYFRIKNMNPEKRRLYIIFYQNSLKRMRCDIPKNFWLKVFLSSVIKTIHWTNLPRLIGLSLIILLLFIPIFSKLIGFFVSIIAFIIIIIITGFIKVSIIKNMIEEYGIYEPDRFDKDVKIFNYLARYYTLHRMKEFLNDYNEFLKLKEYYEGKDE